MKQEKKTKQKEQPKEQPKPEITVLSSPIVSTEELKKQFPNLSTLSDAPDLDRSKLKILKEGEQS